MKHFILITVVFCAALASAQSLGDVARQQREAKKGGSGKVVTNDEIPPSEAGAGSAATSAATAAAAQTLKPLLTDLRSPDLKTRTKAFMYVWETSPRMGPESVQALLPAVTDGALDRDLNVRYMAISSLKNFGRASRPAVSALIKALDTFPGGTPELSGPQRYYADARWVAAETLGIIGPSAKDAVPALTKALKDPSSNVRQAAAAALKNIQAN
ncbi:MAG: HEAT repeat domain-containing protein [Terriglobales bacterium]